MTIRIISILFFFIIIFMKPSWSNNNPENSNNFWQCVAHDQEQKQWVAKSAYERVSANKAFEACKKESRLPNSCKPTQDSCYYYADEVILSLGSGHREPRNVGWQCTALDQAATSWRSQIHNNQDDAALDAKTYCQEHSSAPDSCYINLLTCKGRTSR